MRRDDERARASAGGRDVAVRLGDIVQTGIDLDAKMRSGSAYVRAQPGGALARTGGEDQRIKAAEGRGHLADGEGEEAA